MGRAREDSSKKEMSRCEGGKIMEGRYRRGRTNLADLLLAVLSSSMLFFLAVVADIPILLVVPGVGVVVLSQFVARRRQYASKVGGLHALSLASRVFSIAVGVSFVSCIAAFYLCENSSRDINDAVFKFETALRVMFVHTYFFAISSTISLVAGILGFSRNSKPVWQVVLSLPGALILMWLVFTWIVDA